MQKGDGKQGRDPSGFWVLGSAGFRAQGILIDVLYGVIHTQDRGLGRG